MSRKPRSCIFGDRVGGYDELNIAYAGFELHMEVLHTFTGGKARLRYTTASWECEAGSVRGAA